MKVSCPKCNRTFRAPDEWGGRKVKCPQCKEPMSLPAGDGQGAAADLGFDLGSLDSFEAGGEAIIRESRGKPMTLKEAQAAAAAVETVEQPPTKADPTLRICPGCKEKVRCPDLYSDIICRHCGAPIPGQEIHSKEQPRYTKLSDRMTTSVSFYTGFSSAIFYPLPALGSMGLGMVIALAAIAVPVLPILGFTGASSANEAVQEAADFGWVGITLTVMFALEAIYFGAVSYYVLIDTIRTTSSGAEQPPPLTWTPVKLVSAVGGYAALIGFYAFIIVLLFMIKLGRLPSSLDEFQVLSDPLGLVVLALLTFGVPMNMIGLASSHALDGLNPVRLGPSIGRTIGHYTFLFLIVVLFLGFYIGAMFAVMNWAGPMIMQAATRDSEAGLAKVFLNILSGLAAWSVLIGAAFYFAYSLGRILGLFARTYREKLAFEL